MIVMTDEFESSINNDKNNETIMKVSKNERHWLSALIYPQ